MYNLKRFSLVLTAVFLILEAVLIAHHEMWRDELQPWIIVRNSSSIYMMFQHLIAEVHPGLWYLMLYALNYFTDSPLAMQLVHMVIAGVIVYVFSRYSPFTRLQKVLFAFGYMIFYEYAAVSRSYSTGVLLLFVLCVLFKDRYKRFITLSIVLFLLANTSVIGFIIATAWFMSLVLECLLEWPRIKEYLSITKLVLGYYLIFIGCVISAIQCITPYDPLISSNMNLALGMNPVSVEALSSVAYGIFPIQMPGLHFWDSSVLNSFPPAFRVALSLILIGYTCIVLCGRRTIVCIYSLSTLGMILLYYTFGGAFYRHYGYHYIMFIASLWLLKQGDTAKSVSSCLPKLNTLVRSSLNKVLYFILIVQCLCSINPFYMDLMYPFSTGKRTAKFIKDAGMDQWMVVGFHHCSLASVVGYLNIRLYALLFDRFVLLPNQPVEGVRISHVPKLRDIIHKVPQLRDAYGSRIVFIFNDRVDQSILDKYKLVEIARFGEAICGDEEFYIYAFEEGLGSQVSVRKAG